MKINIFKNKRIMKIKTYGDQVLRKNAIPVEVIDADVIALAARMKETMYDADGVGLAAPQVGASLRMFFLGVPTPDPEKIPPTSPGELLLLPRMPMLFINPEITVITDKQVIAEEGCLSVPSLYAQVRRPEKIMLSATLLNSEKIDVECGGFLARAIQHEMDHLNGILFVDRLDADELAKIKTELNKLKKDQKAGIKSKKKKL
jgi:peptide deformylase